MIYKGTVEAESISIDGVISAGAKVYVGSTLVLGTEAEQLDAPANFEAVANGSDQIDLTWDNSANNEGYLIEVSDNGLTGWTELTTTAADVVSYEHSGLDPEETKYYRNTALGDGVSYLDSTYATDNATTEAIAGYDADAQDYINRVNATGVTLTTPQEEAIDAYVLGLKADGLWADIYDQGLFIGGTAAAHAITLKGVAPSTTWVNTPTHSATGVVGNGTTQYGNLNFAPDDHGTQDDNHFGVYVRNTVTGTNKIEIGTLSLTPTRASYINSAETTAARYHNNSTTSSLAGVSSESKGFTIVNRVASTHQQLYKNGSLVTNAAQASSGVAMNNYYLLGYNQNGTAAAWSNREVCFWTFGSGLDATQNSNLSARANALQTALGGRNVY